MPSLAPSAAADEPMPGQRATEASPSAPDTAAPASAPPHDPFAVTLPGPTTFGSTPMLPAGLTPDAVAAAAARRTAPPVATPPSPDAGPPDASDAAAPAAAPGAAGPAVAEVPAPPAAAVPPPLPQRRPAAEVATTAPSGAGAAPPSDAAAPPVAAPDAAPPEAGTPAVVAGAAPALPRPAPDRPPAAPVTAAAVAAPEPPQTPDTAETEPAAPPTTLAYAPAPGEARPPTGWSSRDGKLPPAARAPAAGSLAAPAPAAVTPPPTPPGTAPIETAEPAEPAPALPTVARPTSADCTALLALGPAVVEEAPDLPQTGTCSVERPVRLKALKMPDGRLVALSPAAELRCDMAAATTAWLRDDLVPALEKTGTAVTAVKIADDFSCRPRNRVKGARMSEHGRGNAVDIGGFKLADGRVLEVAGNGLPKPFRVTMRATACARFKTILGPGSDGYHENHIHVDLAARRSPRSYCRWRIPGTDAS